MTPNDAGMMLRLIWQKIPTRFPTIEMDEFIAMPNHIHGILIIHSPVGVPLVGILDATHAETPASLAATSLTEKKTVNLGEVVGTYKSLTTRLYGQGVETKGWLPYEKRLWQHNYYERVIRNARELDWAREYIANNPAKWELDSENPIASSPP